MSQTLRTPGPGPGRTSAQRAAAQRAAAQRATAQATDSATTGAAAAAPVRRRILHAGSLGMLIAGVITLVGSVLPWVTTPIGSLAGTAGPGLWTLSAGFLAIAGALLPIRWVAIAHCLVPGFAIAAIVVWQVARLLSLSAATDSWGQLLPGIGLVMVAGSAVILLRTGYRLVTSS